MYIDTNTNTYPLYPGDVMLVSPTWQLGDELPNGWFAVEPTDPPTISDTQMYQEATPDLVDGVYVQAWTVRNLTEEELAIRQAPTTAREKLKMVVGLTDAEIEALTRGLR
jgi:hypothetical protein